MFLLYAKQSNNFDGNEEDTMSTTFGEKEQGINEYVHLDIKYFI